MEFAEDPLLHNMAAPLTRLPAVKVDVAQLLDTDTVGAAGADAPVIVTFTPFADVQPFVVIVRLV